MVFAINLEDFDCLVAGTCSQSSTIVVEYCVVLDNVSVLSSTRKLGAAKCSAYNHIIMTRVFDRLRLDVAFVSGCSSHPSAGTTSICVERRDGPHHGGK